MIFRNIGELGRHRLVTISGNPCDVSVTFSNLTCHSHHADEGVERDVDNTRFPGNYDKSMTAKLSDIEVYIDGEALRNLDDEDLLRFIRRRSSPT